MSPNISNFPCLKLVPHTVTFDLVGLLEAKSTRVLVFMSSIFNKKKALSEETKRKNPRIKNKRNKKQRQNKATNLIRVFPISIVYCKHMGPPIKAISTFFLLPKENPFTQEINPFPFSLS